MREESSRQSRLGPVASPGLEIGGKQGTVPVAPCFVGGPGPEVNPSRPWLCLVGNIKTIQKTNSVRLNQRRSKLECTIRNQPETAGARQDEIRHWRWVVTRQHTRRKAPLHNLV